MTEELLQQSAPKKRGRPKKVETVGDKLSPVVETKQEVKAAEAPKAEPVKLRKRRSLASRGSGPCESKAIPGYHTRFIAINDPAQPFALQNALNAGYVDVTPEEQGYDPSLWSDTQSTIDTSSKSFIQRTGRDGISLRLMKLPEEWYNQDIAEFVEANNAQVNRQMAPDPKKVGKTGVPEFGASMIDGKRIK